MNNAGRIGFLIKGEYSSSAAYDFLDIVFYNGASYVAKKSTKGNTPARSNEYWQIFAEGTTISDVSDALITFEQANNRVNVASGEKLSVFAGKVKKFFADLKTVAFSGSYDDLSNKPTIPTVPTALKNPKALTFTGAVTGSYDGSAAKSVAIPSGTNNLLATVPGTWLDAVQGKALNDKIIAQNNDFAKNFVVIEDNFGQQGGCITCNKITKEVYVSFSLSFGTGTMQSGGLIYTFNPLFAPKTRKAIFGMAKQGDVLSYAQIIIDTNGEMRYYGSVDNASFMFFYGSFIYG